MLVVEGLTKRFVRYTYRRFAVPMNYIPLLVLYYKLAERRGRIVREEVEALSSVSFALEEGEVLAVLGPNGSGKTTLLRVLAGLSEPSGGRILLGGVDLTWKPEERRRRFMYIPGLGGVSVFIDKSLTVRDNLRRFAEFGGIPLSRVDEVLEAAGLAEVAGSFIYELSTGYQARLAVAIGLLREAEVYLLDEPFLGLSHEAKVGLADYILDRLVGGLGRSVVIATNTLGDAERLASRFLFLHGGRVIESGDMEGLLARSRLGEKVVLLVEGCRGLAGRLSRYGEAGERERGGAVEVTVLARGGAPLTELLGDVLSAGCRIRSLRVEEPSLEDVYMELYRGRWEKPGGGEAWGCYVVM